MSAPVILSCGCGRAYTRAQVAELECIGVQRIPADEYGPALEYALVNCACGSTKGIDVYDDGGELLAVAS